jgi:hypothetical protein
VNETLLDKLLESGFGQLMNKSKNHLKKPLRKSQMIYHSKPKRNPRTLPPVASAAAVRIPKLKEKYAMSLSGFDVSAKSRDTCNSDSSYCIGRQWMPLSWNFPFPYTPIPVPVLRSFMQQQTLHIDGKTLEDRRIRIYYYDKKKEFRLKCAGDQREPGGKQGDIDFNS